MFPNKKQLSESEISSFCQQIGMIVKAGLPIHYGISILRDEASDSKTKALYAEIYEPMNHGASLYSALSDQPVFPEYMVQMIRLGEETGRLEEVLDSLTSYYERESDIRASIRHALVYPITMTFLMIIVLVIILTQVVPVFSRIYEELIGELTGVALLLMQISCVLQEHATLFISIACIIILLGLLFYQTPFGRVLFHGKGLSMSIATSRFANCMHLALASGLDVDHSLELSEKMVGNPYMVEKIKNCQMHLKHGDGFVPALIHAGIFSRIYSGLLIIGSKTGSMVDVMKKISTSYDESIDENLRRFLAILEPTLIVILSIFVGVILFSFVLPLLGIMSGIG